MPVTTKQIAELAGVSRGTVDRVRNGRGGAKKETAARVRMIAEQLGYVPNRAGRALQSARFPIKIGMALNSVGNLFYGQILEGIAAAVAAYSDFHVLTPTRTLRGYDPIQQVNALEDLRSRGARLIIVTPISSPDVAQKIDALSDAGIPVITLNTDIENTKRMVYVGCDYQASGRAAAGMLGLLRPAGANVAIVTGSMQMLGHRQRVEGFLECLKDDFPQIKLCGLVENQDDEIISYSHVRRLLLEKSEIDAFYFGVASLQGGMRAIAESLGDRVPFPTVIASDDLEATRSLMREGRVQATICQEPFRQGYDAVRIALDYLITGRGPAESVHNMHSEIKIAQNL